MRTFYQRAAARRQGQPAVGGRAALGAVGMQDPGAVDGAHHEGGAGDRIVQLGVLEDRAVLALVVQEAQRAAFADLAQLALEAGGQTVPQVGRVG